MTAAGEGRGCGPEVVTGGGREVVTGGGGREAVEGNLPVRGDDPGLTARKGGGRQVRKVGGEGRLVRREDGRQVRRLQRESPAAQGGAPRVRTKLNIPEVMKEDSQLQRESLGASRGPDHEAAPRKGLCESSQRNQLVQEGGTRAICTRKHEEHLDIVRLCQHN